MRRQTTCLLALLLAACVFQAGADYNVSAEYEYENITKPSEDTNAVGCPDLPVPAHAWMLRIGDNVQISCNDTSERWYLICRDSEWIGDIGNCSLDYDVSAEYEYENITKPSEDTNATVTVEQWKYAQWLLGELTDPAFYNKDVIPISNGSAVKAKFGLTMISLFGVSNDGYINGHYWLPKMWKDVRLSWNPEDYGGITTLRVPIDLIWVPDIMLFNAYSKHPEPEKTLAIVYSTGDVLQINPAIMSSQCDIDDRMGGSSNFSCSLKFGSWTYDGYLIDLEFYNDLEEIDLSDYVPSKEWEVLSTEAVREVKYYPCCPEPYLDLKFTLNFARRSRRGYN